MFLKTAFIYRAFLLCLLALTCLQVNAMDKASNAVADSISHKPRIDKNMRLALQQFVSQYASHPKNAVQHIHIARVKTDTGETALYGYWKEDQSILIVQFFAHPSEETGLLWLHHKARIDLKTDVVATEEEMSGSNYLVTRAWADNIVNTCLQQGQLLLLKRKPARK